MEMIKEGYVRVSEILSIFQNYSQVPKDKLKKAIEIGRGVHESIEGFFKGEFEPVKFRQIPYMESFYQWVESDKPEPIFFEKRFYDDELMITGQLDLLMRRGEEIVVVDFKTGSWFHPEIWRLQATFYRYLLGGEHLPEKFLFVMLKKDGTFPFLWEERYKDRDWEVCKAAITAYKYFRS